MAELRTVVVTYRPSLAVLERTLVAHRQAVMHALRAGMLTRTELVVVDNSVDPGIAASLQAMLDRLVCPIVCSRLVVAAANEGFGIANNRGFADLASDWCLILNPDAVLAEDALTLGLEALAHDRQIDAVAPNGRQVDGSPAHLAKRYPSVLVLGLRAFAPATVRRWFDGRLAIYERRDLLSVTASADVALASGCCLLVRSSTLRRVAGFDPRYFLYFEDFDLAWRISRRGRISYLPQMRIEHGGGHTARKGWWHIRLFVVSMWRFFGKFGWRWV